MVKKMRRKLSSVLSVRAAFHHGGFPHPPRQLGVLRCPRVMNVVVAPPRAHLGHEPAVRLGVEDAARLGGLPLEPPRKVKLPPVRVGADGEGPGPLLPLVRVRHGRLDIPHAVDRGVPAEVRVPEAVHVRPVAGGAGRFLPSKVLYSNAAKVGSHRLWKVRVEQHALLRAQLQPREEVRERHDRRVRVSL